MIEPKNWTIKITKQDILTAKPNHSGRCMVANGGRHCIFGSYSIDVTADTFRFNLGEGKDATRFVYDIPARVGAFIAAFDDEEKRKTLKPFIFRLDARQCAVRLVEFRPKHPETKRKTVKFKTTGSKKDKACHRKSIVRRRHGLKVLELLPV